MFAKIKALFVTEVQTVETILSGWFTQVEKLEQHAVDTLKASYGHREVAATAIDAAEALEEEAKKAAAVAEKIKAVISN